MPEVLQSISDKVNGLDGAVPASGTNLTNKDLALFVESIIRERAKRRCNLLDPNRTHLGRGKDHCSLEILGGSVARIVRWEEGRGVSTRHRALEFMPGSSTGEDYLVLEGISDISPETGIRNNLLANVTHPIELSVVERVNLAKNLQFLHSSN